MYKTIAILVLVAAIVVLGWLFLSGENQTDEVSVEAAYESKVVYTTDTTVDPAPLQADCQERGGFFNSCGTPCPPDAETCAAVCAFTCELEVVETDGVTSTVIEAGIGQESNAFAVTIEPLELLEDSRCPVGTNCLNDGPVRVRALVANGSGEREVVFTMSSAVNTETETITLTDIEPDKLVGEEIEAGRYLFAFRIEKRQ